ncbi:MAG: hypothetical protein RLZZ303_2989 [Candidatus Hydrogenedentota bacterium]|jgi:hypothetical protein
MNLVVWNCQGGFHSKFKHLIQLRPDVAIIPESTHPDTVAQKMAGCARWTDADWIGPDKGKGLAVFGFNGHRITRDPSYSQSRRWILPLRVSGRLEFRLLAVWDFEYERRFSDNAGGGRSGQIELALNESGWLNENLPIVIAGDFNNCAAWDKQNKLRSISCLANFLKRHKIVSAYHYTHQLPLGQEQHPTYWQNRRPESTYSYHIDYIFAPEAWMNSGASFDLGTHEEWCAKRAASDHAPLSLRIPPECDCPEGELKEGAFEALLKFLQPFADPGFEPSVWIDGEPGQVPHEEIAKEVSAFLTTLYEYNWICKFDWPTWARDDGASLLFNPTAERRVSLGVLRKLLTCYVRADRFSEGTLSKAIREGSIGAILARVAEFEAMRSNENSQTT